MLSTAALEKHKGEFDMYKQQMKLDRVRSYVANQQRYVSQYHSPNSSDIGSVPESCENQETLSSNAFSASISEIIRRKQAHSEAAAAPSSSTHHHHPSPYQQQQQQQQQSLCSSIRKQPPFYPSLAYCYAQKAKRPQVPKSVHQEGSSLIQRKRYKSSSVSSSHVSERLASVQTKPPTIIKKATHGMHLLQKFVSPNLEMNRITMKSNMKRPKLGIFRKGKSSAQGRPTIPDVTDFYESTTSHKPYTENIHSTAAVMQDLSHEPPSISKFFGKRPAHQTLHSASSQTHHATTSHQDCKPREMSVLSSSAHHQARRGSGSPAAAAAAPFEAFTNNSFDSIYRLLDECQDMDHYLTPTRNPHHANNPSYSHVKTPHSTFQPAANTSNLSFLNNSKLPHPLYPSPDTAYRASTPLSESLFAHHNSNTHSPYYDSPPQPVRNPSFTPPPFQDHHQRLSAPLWQVAESVASFAADTAADEEHAHHVRQDKAAEKEEEENDEDDHTAATANDDLELILQSQAMNMLGESIRQNDENIQNFWLHQPGFTRGH